MKRATQISDNDRLERILNENSSIDLGLDQAEYHITRPITISADTGKILNGRGVTIYWEGEDSQHRLAMLNFLDQRRPLIENLHVQVTAPLGCAVRFAQTHRGEGGKVISTNHRIRDCLIEGGGDLGIGFWWDCQGERHRPNNEHADVTGTRVSLARVGWQIEGSQSKYHSLSGCHFEGGPLRNGLTHSQCAVRSSGSFSWDRGSAYGCATAAFEITDQTDTIQIRSADVEKCLRFLLTGSPAGRTAQLQPVEIDGGRFMCDALHEDGGALWLRHPGPLTVRNFQIGSGQQPAGLILADSSGEVRILLDGVVWGSWIPIGDGPLQLVVLKWGAMQVDARGCSYHNHEGKAFSL